jgi:hypothetical protein
VQDAREATLFALRPYVESDGGIPAEFDEMVSETFGELIGDRR